MSTKKVMAVMFAVVAVMFLAVGAAFAQENTITVEGTGIVNMDPDLVKINVAINNESRSIQDTVNNNTEMVKKVREALIEIGLSESDLITTNFSLWSGYLYYMDENADPEAKKYTVNYSMQIVLRDASRLNEVLDTAVNSGITSIDTVSHEYSDRLAMYEEARKLALADARAKADTIADELGKKIVDVVTVEMPDYSEASDMRYNMAAREGMGGMGGGASTPEITSGAYQASARLRVTYLFE